ncbi:MAG: class I SAM-dependent methyltransferase [Akkermansiaceae bacterium]
MAEESTRQPSPDLADVYPDSGTKATPALGSIITENIKKSGPMPFSRFMALALYHPELGYYSSDRKKTGKQGDFITSVSVGSCFGSILARRLHCYWLESGKPADFQIIEPGAHDGTLANDILSEANKISKDYYQAIHYHLIEVSKELRCLQQSTLTKNHKDKFSTQAAMEGIQVRNGAIISNELIDAFPVELIKYNDKKWLSQMVSLDEEGQFTLATDEIETDEIQVFFDDLGNHYPDGYTTEYNIGMTDFVRDASRSIESGLFLTIDYGHLQSDYYHPDRSTGTLQTYQAHQKAENPLQSPGELDITAHVDFTRLQKTAEQAGFHSPWFGTQARYLTEHAREWLLSMEGTANTEMIRQFQTLTHPSMLGTRFSVLEMRK